MSERASIQYDMAVVRGFAISALIWGAVGMLVGLLAALQLGLVVRAVRRGEFDDWEGPAARHYLDADGCPERDAERDHAPPAPRDGE